MPLRCLLAVLAIAVVFLFCPALILVMFLMSLMPVTLAERQARLWLAQALRERGYGVPGAYYLLTKAEPVFFVAYWPARLSRSKLALPPPALGELRDKEPCRWDLRAKFPMATVPREICLGRRGCAGARQPHRRRGHRHLWLPRGQTRGPAAGLGRAVPEGLPASAVSGSRAAGPGAGRPGRPACNSIGPVSLR